VNGVHDSAEIGILKAQLQARDQKIAMLEQETAVLQDRVMLNEVDVSLPMLYHYRSLNTLQAEAPIPERLRTSKWFQVMEENMRRTHEALKEKSEAYLKAVNELENLTASKSAWEQGVMVCCISPAQSMSSQYIDRSQWHS